MGKTAFITGITGQDGAYLGELLLSKGYTVHGMRRRSSLSNTGRIDGILSEANRDEQRFHLHHGDLTDSLNILRLIQDIQPDEIYNLAAMSHVHVSFQMPEYTANADGIGTLRILEAVRNLGLTGKTRIYQASTSELYGLVQAVPQNERTPFYPRSPYAAAKLYAYWITVNYRESYGMYACNGILFNHESPLRGETFVTRKITRAAARIALGLEQTLHLGNLSAKRDWGHARDYAEAMWMILQQEKPQDYVIATGVTTEVREFVRMAFAELGIEIEFSGAGTEEVGKVKRCTNPEFQLPEGRIVVAVDPRFYRPAEVDLLLGDAAKARRELGWKPKTDLKALVSEMVQADLAEARKVLLLRRHGIAAPLDHEA